MTCSLETAKSAARNNSRTTGTIWAVLPDDHGFDIREVKEFVPYRVVAAFKNGRKLKFWQGEQMKDLAIACGNHPYEDGGITS